VRQTAAIAVLAVAAFGLLAAGPAQAQGVVHTPYGDRPASCVYHVPAGSQVMNSQTVQYPDATKHSFVPCANPHPTPATNGWVESALNNSAAYTGISGQWIVPAAPALSQGQTIYLFNGIQTSGIILQPVLQWDFGGSNSWNMTSWICDSNCYYSDPINVTVGDFLTGTTLFDPATGNWQIESDDNTNGNTTTLTVSSSAANGTSGEAWGGVLEVYSVGNCLGYPNTFSVPFFNTSLVANGNTVTDPAFVPQIWRNDGCGEGVDINGVSLAMSEAAHVSNGVCGSANGVAVSSAPSSGLCSSGTASAITGTGPWNWSCAGSNGGSTAQCSAPNVSPDGTIITAPNGRLITSAGAWTYGSAQQPGEPGQYQILLNGGNSLWCTGCGYAAKMEVAHGGVLYAYNSLVNGWWVWNGSAWASSSAP
jgi:hypothetical protein